MVVLGILALVDMVYEFPILWNICRRVRVVEWSLEPWEGRMGKGLRKVIDEDEGLVSIQRAQRSDLVPHPMSM